MNTHGGRPNGFAGQNTRPKLSKSTGYVSAAPSAAASRTTAWTHDGCGAGANFAGTSGPQHAVLPALLAIQLRYGLSSVRGGTPQGPKVEVGSMCPISSLRCRVALPLVEARVATTPPRSGREGHVGLMPRNPGASTLPQMMGAVHTSNANNDLSMTERATRHQGTHTQCTRQSTARSLFSLSQHFKSSLCRALVRRCNPCASVHMRASTQSTWNDAHTEARVTDRVVASSGFTKYATEISDTTLATGTEPGW